MAYVVYPTNNNSRSLFLKTCVKSIAEDQASGNSVLGMKTMTDMGKLNEDYHAVLNQKEKSATLRAHEVSEKVTALERGEMFIRHFWSSARNKAMRENYPAAYLTYFGLPLSGLSPQTNPSPSLLPLFDTIIEGEAEAVAAGYEPVANPSVEELLAIKTVAEKEVSDVSVADKELDTYTSEFAAIRDLVDKQARDIVLELRFLLRDEDEPSQRRIMRKYGVTFRSDQETAQAE